jgi:hypothetical protein
LVPLLTVTDYHEGGNPALGTVCDWTFSSQDTVKGELHTPDSVLYNDTTCRYDFYGVDDNDRIEIQIIAQQQHEQQQQQQLSKLVSAY